MPRAVAPPPSGEFQVALSKPFSGKSSSVRGSSREHVLRNIVGAPTHMIEVIGEPNRSASIRMSNYSGNAKSSEKKGDVPQYVSPHHIPSLLSSTPKTNTNTTSRDDVRELMSLISTLRGFPSHPSKDVYGLDTKVDFNTMEVQWSNQDDDAAMAGGELAGEQKDEFKRITDSIEALARQFAKQDSPI
jgi:hypothetical protein